jgi:hypothetical protein
MSPPQLTCRSLKSGDIMLQHSLGNAAGRAIAFGQALTGHKHTDIIHAGVMFDNAFIIEALDAGIGANDIRVGNRNCGYVVFRPRNAKLATVAGNLAKLLFDEHGALKNLKYDTKGAIASIGRSTPAKSNAELDTLMDNVLFGEGQQDVLLAIRRPRLSDRRGTDWPGAAVRLLHGRFEDGAGTVGHGSRPQ